MTAYKFVTLTCDTCGEIYDDGRSVTVRDSRRAARSEGWAYRNDEDVCPLHNGWERDGMYGYRRAEVVPL